MAPLIMKVKEGLACLPLLRHAPPPPGTDIPPFQLMSRPYMALTSCAKDKLIENLRNEHPALAYYWYTPQIASHPFVALGKFITGRIYQRRTGKSYLAALTPPGGLSLSIHDALIAILFT